jgi:hypothetical protein
MTCIQPAEPNENWWLGSKFFYLLLVPVLDKTYWHLKLGLVGVNVHTWLTVYYSKSLFIGKNILETF